MCIRLIIYNMVMSMATDVGLNPSDESPASQKLRLNFWDVLANPPVGSVYHMPAAEARNATAQQCTTVAHREAFLAAMVKAIDTQVQASGKRPPKKHWGGQTGAGTLRWAEL